MASRVSQCMVEVLGQSPGSSARVSQCMVEVLVSIAVAPPDAGGTSGNWYRDLTDDESELYEDYL